MFQKLFERVKISELELKNRIVFPPMVTCYSSHTHRVTEKLINHYVDRARGGAGLVIVEATSVSPEGGLGIHRRLAIDSDECIPGLRKLASAVKISGARVAIQLNHAGRGTSASITGVQPVAPSSLPCTRGKLPGEVAKELSIDEIKRLEKVFAEGGRRAKEAGFDAIEIHMAHGYLISSFLSPRTNLRRDKYGGDLKGRARFACEIINKMRGKVGERYPIICRINGDDFIPGGLTLRDSKVIAKMLVETSSDCIHVSGGVRECGPPQLLGQVDMAATPGSYVHLAHEIKKVVDVPVITVFRINTPQLAEMILREEKADLVAMGRALLADPQLPNKSKEGKLDDIRLCVACNQGCHEYLERSEPITCTVNPALGREEEYRIKPARKRKKILVAGGGPAGMEAARVAALRRHEVVLFEKNEKLGGQLVLSSKVPYREEWKNVINYLSTQINKAGVSVELRREVTPKIIEKEDPDVIIAATGISPDVPDVYGTGDNVVFAANAIADRQVGAKVVVLCSRICCAARSYIGCQTALYLAKRGKQVTIATEMDDLWPHMYYGDRRYFGWRLLDAGVRVLLKAEKKEIMDTGIIVEWHGMELNLEADTLISTSYKPNREILQALKGRMVYSIGDCAKIGNTLKAIHDGSEIARRI